MKAEAEIEKKTKCADAVTTSSQLAANQGKSDDVMAEVVEIGQVEVAFNVIEDEEELEDSEDSIEDLEAQVEASSGASCSTKAAKESLESEHKATEKLAEQKRSIVQILLAPVACLIPIAVLVVLFMGFLLIDFSRGDEIEDDSIQALVMDIIEEHDVIDESFDEEPFTRIIALDLDELTKLKSKPDSFQYRTGYYSPFEWHLPEDFVKAGTP